MVRGEIFGLDTFKGGRVGGGFLPLHIIKIWIERRINFEINEKTG
jgi:hypothetical protein